MRPFPSRRHAAPRRLFRPARGIWAILLACACLAGTALAAAGGAGRDPAAAVVQVARQQLGDAYAWGGNGPDSWDCSGLTSRLWREVGGVAGIPRTSRAQQEWTVAIPAAQALPGDLVFFKDPVDHVGLYVGAGRMIDTSSSKGKVLERDVWTTGVVRYGRVPREGMPAVRPWQSPRPTPSAAPSPAASRPAAKTSPSPSPTRTRPAALLRPLAGLPARQAQPSSVLALRAVSNARSVLGSPRWSDLSLVQVAWRHAGGAALPASRAEIVRRARPVALDDVRVGDLVVYGQPAAHLGFYAGHGYLVDASPLHRKVVVRRVYADPTVRFARLG